MKRELDALVGREVELTLTWTRRTENGGQTPWKMRGRIHSVAESTVYLLHEDRGGMENALGGGLSCAPIAVVKHIDGPEVPGHQGALFA